MKLPALLIYLALLLSHQSPDRGRIQLSVKETKSDSGVVRVLIFNDKTGFPEDPNQAFKAMELKISNTIAAAEIIDLPPGEYAIAVFHDKTGHGKIRKNSIGIPIDSYGFSNNPSILFGAPSFQKCVVKVRHGKTHRVEIKLR